MILSCLGYVLLIMQSISNVLARKFSFPVKFQRTRRYLNPGEHFIRGSSSEIELTSPVVLAGRKYLACSDTAGLPKFLSGPRDNYPVLLKAQNGQGTTLTHWAKRSREVIDEAYRKYREDGTAVAILFRGLPITNEKDFAEWGDGLGYESFSYVGVVRRFHIAPNVTSGTDDPKEFTMDLHNDVSYNITYPKMIAICSLKTALRGGETAICDVREILPNSGERLWFNQLVQAHCTAHQYSPLFEGIELPNNKYPYHTTFGDGEEFDRRIIDEVRRASWESAVGFQWKDGDVMFMDQLIVQHSRLGYEGDRKVGISLFTY